MRPSQADQLVEMASEGFDFHISTDGDPSAVPKYGSSVGRMLRGRRNSLRSELAATFNSSHKKVPTSNALREALDVVEGLCHQGSPVELHLRTARTGGDIFIDLGSNDDTSGDSFVRIGQGSWELVPIAPQPFRRTPLTGEMPIPRRDGNIEDLRRFVNLDEGDFRLWIAWLVASFLPDIPHPVLVIRGAQGTGKSTLVRLTVDLIDPSPAPLRSAPRTTLDYSVGTSASWCVAYDNLSGLADWFSDALCRTVTGDGLVRRALYTNDDVAVDTYRRVLILNGIDPGVVRGDLIDRSVFIELPEIEPKDRLLDRAISKDFRRTRPDILGALLDVTAMTLMTLPAVHLDSPPRMADFAQVLVAVDQALGWSSYDTYTGKTRNAQVDAIESSPVAAAIVALIDEVDTWTGTATQLEAKICPDPRPRTWPSTMQGLSAEVTRAEPALKLRGIRIERRRESSQRIIEIKRVGSDASSSSSASSTHSNTTQVPDEEAMANVMEMFPESEVLN